LSKSESDYKTAFVKSLRVDGWYARRIEDQYAVGIPDILVGIPYGPTVMVEAKLVKHQSFAPTPRQYIELQRWDKHNKPQSVYPPHYRFSWLLGFKEGVMYLHSAAEQVKIEDCLASSPGEKPSSLLMRFWNKCLMTDK